MEARAVAYGDGPHDEVLRNGWKAFCTRLEEAGERVFKDANPATSVQRADGFRFVTQCVGQAFDLALETKDTAYPSFHAFCGPTRKLGSDNADAVYLQAWIDGRSVYRVTGTKGSARFWNMTIQGARPESAALHEPFGDTPQATLSGAGLVTDENGRFELFIGGEQRGPNWLPTTPESRKIFFRQFFDDFQEEPANCQIERVGMEQPPAPPNHERLLEAMEWAGNFVDGAIRDWPDVLWQGGALCDPEAPNRFAGSALLARLATGPDPARDAEDERRGRLLAQMRWILEPDEALILDFEAYDDLWMVGNEAVFGNSMDYRYRSVSFTPSRTAIDADGCVRIVIAHCDPGVANWLDTSGFSHGVTTFRSVLSAHMPELRTRVVAHSDIDAVLPADTKRISPAERTRLMLERFRAIHRRSPV
jgi:Protein of unknown function (DUF1214)